MKMAELCSLKVYPFTLIYCLFQDLHVCYKKASQKRKSKAADGSIFKTFNKQ